MRNVRAPFLLLIVLMATCARISICEETEGKGAAEPAKATATQGIRGILLGNIRNSNGPADPTPVKHETLLVFEGRHDAPPEKVEPVLKTMTNAKGEYEASLPEGVYTIFHDTKMLLQRRVQRDLWETLNLSIDIGL